MFYINLAVFRYGTKDKAHGAAVLLSILLFFLLVGVIIAGYWQPPESEWHKAAFQWALNHRTGIIASMDEESP